MSRKKKLIKDSIDILWNIFEDGVYYEQAESFINASLDMENTDFNLETDFGVKPKYITQLYRNLSNDGWWFQNIDGDFTEPIKKGEKIVLIDRFNPTKYFIGYSSEEWDVEDFVYGSSFIHFYDTSVFLRGNLYGEGDNTLVRNYIGMPYVDLHVEYIGTDYVVLDCSYGKDFVTELSLSKDTEGIYNIHLSCGKNRFKVSCGISNKTYNLILDNIKKYREEKILTTTLRKVFLWVNITTEYFCKLIKNKKLTQQDKNICLENIIKGIERYSKELDENIRQLRNRQVPYI